MEVRPLLQQALTGTSRADVAGAYRAEASSRGVDGEVRDLLAVQMLERDLALMPRDLTLTPSRPSPIPHPPSSSLARSAAYTAHLAAALGGGALAPAVLSVLESFPAPLFEPQPGVQQLGTSPVSAEATEKLSSVAMPSGLTVLGSWNEAECALADKAVETMASRLPGSRELVQKVILRTFVAGAEDKSVAGQFHWERPGEVHLSRFQLAERGEGTLWHETGHALDQKLGDISEAPDSPFGKGPGPWAFVSEYAMTSPREDFAETHEDLVKNWDQYMAMPEVFLYAEGPKADKRRFILEKGYGMELPPAREFWPRLQAQAASGPFGWETADGRRVGLEGDLQRSVALFNQGSTEPGPAWLRATLTGGQPEAGGGKTIDSVRTQVSEAKQGSGNLLMFAYLRQPEVHRAEAAEVAQSLGLAEPPAGGELLTHDEQMTMALACYRAGGDEARFGTLTETLGVGGESLKKELRSPGDGAFERWLFRP